MNYAKKFIFLIYFILIYNDAIPQVIKNNQTTNPNWKKHFEWDEKNKSYFKNKYNIDLISRGGKLGIVNNSGEIIIPFKYDYLHLTKYGIIAGHNNKYGFFDYSGNETIPLKYDYFDIRKEWRYQGRYSTLVLAYIGTKYDCYEWIDVGKVINEDESIKKENEYRKKKIDESKRIIESKAKFGFAFGPTISFFPNFAAGGELSIFLINRERSSWYRDKIRFNGVYFDFLHDTNTKNSRFTLGPEIGSFKREDLVFLGGGIDGGVVLSQGDGKICLGYAVRPFVMIVLPVFVYYRFIWLNESGDKNIIHEFGVSIKLPVLF